MVSREKTNSTNTTHPFPEEVLEKILSETEYSNKDRNSFSLVNKTWYEAETWTRRHVFVRNCYPVRPEVVSRRFTRVTCITLQGYPGYFMLLPKEWRGFGNNVDPWLVMFAKSYPSLEELRLNSVRVSDKSLEFLAKSFPRLKVLSLLSCYGFTTGGLEAIPNHCKLENDHQEFFKGYDAVFEQFDTMDLQGTTSNTTYGMEGKIESYRKDHSAKYHTRGRKGNFGWSIQRPLHRSKRWMVGVGGGGSRGR